jgi:Co/Zn/Cd efflux system component
MKTREDMRMQYNSENRPGQQQRLRWVLLLTVSFMIVEVVVGLFTGSLTLLADASHMLTDEVELSLSLFAIWVAGKPATSQKTYHYHRAMVLAVVVNAVVLLLLTVWIVYEAYNRFWQPPQIHGVPMALVGLMGVAVDVAGIQLLGDPEEQTEPAHRLYGITERYHHVDWRSPRRRHYLDEQMDDHRSTSRYGDRSLYRVAHLDAPIANHRYPHGRSTRKATRLTTSLNM